MGRNNRTLIGERSTGAWLAAWVVLAAVCIWSYWPGLQGPFLLDDHGTLSRLGSLGGVDDWLSFRAFVLGGHAGPTGRPVALLSFLLDANTWPTDPWPFKRTNLAVHLLCGMALGTLVNRVLAMLGHGRPAARTCALAAAAIWMLHPFLVSTALYPVQRMAQLAALFVFAGLAAYLGGRAMLPTDARKAYLVMSLAIVLATVLATLSKENGILMPLLVGIAELTIVSSQRSRLGTLNRAWAAVFIAVPAVLVFSYLAWKLAGIDPFATLPGRDFSVQERLLTQFRVLADYLRHWFVPELYTAGVFQDHVVKSTGLLAPVTTILGLALHGGLVAAAVRLRRRRPLFSFAVLFFYGGHLLESTVLNLELYFEHRNYLPAAFLAVPPVVALYRALPRRASAIAILSLAALLAAFTHFSATVWADYRSIVAAAAEKAPTSVRAQQQLATLQFNDGEYHAALDTIDRGLEARPDSHTLQLTRGIILCRIGTLDDRTFGAVAHAVSQKVFDGRIFDTYSTFVAALVDGKCIENAPSKARAMLTRMLDVPGNADPTSTAYSHVEFLIGYTHLAEGDTRMAIEAFRRSFDAVNQPGTAMRAAAVLASAGRYDEALDFAGRALDLLDSERRAGNGSVRVRRSDVLEFQQRVREARAAGAAAPSGD